MKSVRQLYRLLLINHVLAKNGLDQLIVSIRLFSPFRFVIYFNPWNWFRKDNISRGEALRRSLEALGPIFIKFGQALSTRPDVIPADIIVELSRLQDSVPPFPTEQVLRLIEEAYGQSAYDVFASFDPVPLASASVAQVHSAILKTGQEVVVKILRPNLRKVMEQDLSLLKVMAKLAHRYWAFSRRFKPREIVQEFEYSLLNELDLIREAANGSQLRRNFLHSPLLYIPEVHWDYVRENILVMERIHGIPVTDMASLEAHHVDIKKLAERGLEIFFTQVFRDCFFHADMHPGNIFVSRKHPNDPQYICIDFGIMGTLDEQDRRYLAENLYAFLNRDYRRVAQLHVESGWVAKDTRVGDFEMAIRTVCEPIFEKPIKEISFAMVVMRLFQVARSFDMQVQPQLILLQKTLLAIEGLGRQIYPQLDLWATAKPFLEKWLKEQMGPKAFLKHLRENIPFMVEQLPYMPRLVNDVLLLAKEQKIQSLAHMSHNKHQYVSQATWWNGLGIGVFLSMLAVGAMSYLHGLPKGKEGVLVFCLAIFGGVLALASRKRKRFGYKHG